MMPLGALLLPALCFLGAVIPPGLQYATFSHNATKFLHLIMDPNSGTLYLGATNFLFQLTSGLALEEAVSTGPSLDSKDCLPPVTRQECPQAQETDNYNKLLLVNSPKEELIVCGSVWQGICEKRRLGFIDRVLFQPQTPGDTQYVAANDPNISTVGLIGYAKDNMPLLFVGRGYTSRGVGGSIPPITTRNLGTHPEQDPHSIFSYEETAKLAVGRLSEYNHHFVKSFTHGSSVYFLFYRRDLKSHSREYRTYISRICLDDAHYYSYVELPLLCRSKGKTYSHLQAAYVSQPGGEGGAGRGDVLFVAFSAWQASSGKLSEESALCIYTMDEVDRLATRTRDLCYTKDGKSEEGVEVAYIEYDVSSNCVQLSADTLDAYPCGSDHTPSPMASRVPLEAEPILEKPDARLTAVAVSIEDGHTVIFLGDSKGCLHKVYLGPMGDANLYASLVIQPNSAVSGDLLFDLPKKHLYVMTQSMVTKIPIFECSQYPDCESCLALRDPYCGWCVLQGRCSRRSECSRFKVSEQWLWGFESTQQCLSVQSLSPANISREEQKNVFLTLSDLPALRDGESYTCFFEEYESPAVPMGSGIMCLSPDPSHAPVLKAGTDHVTIQLMVRFNDVFITSTPFSFYDCRAVALLRKSAPCQGCVSSHWGCNWCVHQHLCTHKDASPTTDGLTSLGTDAPTLPPTDVPATASPTSEVVSSAQPETEGPVTHSTSEPVLGPEDWSTSPPATVADGTLRPHVEAQTPSPDAENSTSVPSAAPEALTSPVPTSLAPNQTGSAPNSSADSRPEDLETELATSEAPPATGFPDWPPGDSSELEDSAEWVDSLPPENDTSSFSASILLSGDGDSSESDVSDIPRILNPGLDYQYDAPGFLDLNEELSQGPEACPCVRGIQGSSLMPVNVQRKITLIGSNFHLYQDNLWEYECVLVLEGKTLSVEAHIEQDETNPSLCYITCQLHQPHFLIQRTVLAGTHPCLSLSFSAVTLYNCSVGHLDCSRCQTADAKYGCVWCSGEQPSCLFRDSCKEDVADTCPAPLIHAVYPLTGLVEGGTRITITGSNLGQKHQDIAGRVTVAGIPCEVDALVYEISSRELILGSPCCSLPLEFLWLNVPSFLPLPFAQNPELKSIYPTRGPKAGGTCLTLTGSKLLTGNPSKISILVGRATVLLPKELQCLTSASNASVELNVTIKYGDQERSLEHPRFKYTLDPNITYAEPAKSFQSGGREIRVRGHNLDVVQWPKIRVTVSPLERRRRGLGRWRRIIPDTECPENALCSVQQVGLPFEEPCEVNSSSLILCKTPAIKQLSPSVQVKLEFVLDNLSFDFNTVHPRGFSYEVDPVLHPLNMDDHTKPYRHKPGSVISVEGENLDLAISKEEVKAMIGVGVCSVKTLTKNHLYCEPPAEQPAPLHRAKREGTDSLPEFTVQMGNNQFRLGRVQYDTESQLTFPVEAQIGLGVVASFVALIVLIIVFIYRRKSKQALRDYKKVQIQLENLETSVRDRCKKEFTDLMTEMMDLTSDLVGTGIPFLDYKSYAERVFFPGHRESPLQRDLDVPECRRQTVEQGLVQLSNLLNSKLFLTKFIHTLEIQRTFSPRDRAYVASLLTVSLHGKLEYFTDILKTLLNDLVEQYVAKNPKLMLRRTETVVEKLLTNWMSICLYAFVRDSVGEPLYMLFRGIKHQVDKGPVDWVTGKAKYTLNDNRLLREDLEYRTLVRATKVLLGRPEGSQGVLVKGLDCDTITQVKEKILDQVYKGTPYCHRPDPDTLDLEWRSGLAGHLILSDEDVTSVVQGNWKRLNTLQHYKVPDGATVALVPRMTKHLPRENQDYIPGEKTPMLEDADEGGMKLWHLVKPTEEPELPKHRRGSVRERERAKAIPEIYLTRLLSMKGTMQKFVDDLFQVILSTSRPVPLAVKYFFDLLDDQALSHGITDPETIHIWKTNSLPLRFWINIIKNPQFVFDVQTSDNVDAVLLVIAQTFMDSCTLADHKLGRDSPINKLLYARDIPRYKQMVERYYADIRQTISASDQEMNSALAELSRNYSGDLNSLVALHELYKYINKYYDQIITALEEDPTAQKMQLGYRLQQIAAAVENKVTDL
uniref:Plexin-B1 n=1 Tax=Podarcis muralis TaxID=64176 RepID=A0A670K9I5_PODMU